MIERLSELAANHLAVVQEDGPASAQEDGEARHAAALAAVVKAEAELSELERRREELLREQSSQERALRKERENAAEALLSGDLRAALAKLRGGRRADKERAIEETVGILVEAIDALDRLIPEARQRLERAKRATYRPEQEERDAELGELARQLLANEEDRLAIVSRMETLDWERRRLRGLGIKLPTRWPRMPVGSGQVRQDINEVQRAIWFASCGDWRGPQHLKKRQDEAAMIQRAFDKRRRKEIGEVDPEEEAERALHMEHLRKGRWEYQRWLDRTGRKALPGVF